MNKVKKNICFPFSGDSVGGSHISAISLIKELKKTSYINPIIVLHKKNNELSKYLHKNSLKFTEISLFRLMLEKDGRIKKIYSILVNIFLIYFWLKKNNIDFVHTNDARMHLTWIIPAKLNGSKLFWHQRTLYGRSIISNILIHLSYKVIAISNAVSKSLYEISNVKNFVIYDPVTINKHEFINKDKRKELTKSHKGKVIILGFFGNLRKIKKPITFLETAIKLQKIINGNVLAVVFGEDRENYKIQMQEVAKKNNFNKKLIFMGFKYPIEEWMSSCDILIAPSSWEAFGRTIVEAMLLKIPVIASQSAGHSEIVIDNENGFLAPIDDSGKMANIAKNLLTKKDNTSAIVKKAEKWAITKFSAKQHVESVVNLYFYK